MAGLIILHRGYALVLNFTFSAVILGFVFTLQPLRIHFLSFVFFDLGEFLSRGEDVEACALQFGLAGRDDDENVRVYGEAREDEIESRGFDNVFGELLRRG